MRSVVLSFFVFLLALCAASAAHAANATPTLLGSYKSWDAFTFNNGKGKVCYIVSAPTDSSPKNVKRGDIYLLISHRPAEKVRNEVNIIAGYPYGPNSSVRATVDGKAYELFTQGENAWLEKPADETRMVEAMKAGATLTVVGKSNRGTTTTDRYSLLGFTAAHNAISKACGAQ